MNTDHALPYPALPSAFCAQLGDQESRGLVPWHSHRLECAKLHVWFGADRLDVPGDLDAGIWTGRSALFLASGQPVFAMNSSRILREVAGFVCQLKSQNLVGKQHRGAGPSVL